MPKAEGPQILSFVITAGRWTTATKFDSSYSRGESIQFALNRVIDGWTEGLQYCPEGGMIELEIPSALGYKEEGSPPKIQGGATLHFIVELIEIDRCRGLQTAHVR